MPDISERAFAGLIVLGAIGTNIAWEFLKSVMGDPLYQASPALTLLSLPIAAMVRETVVYLRRHLVLEPWGTTSVLGLATARPAGACPACGAATAPGDAWCRACGAALTPPEVASRR